MNALRVWLSTVSGEDARVAWMSQPLPWWHAQLDLMSFDPMFWLKNFVLLAMQSFMGLIVSMVVSRYVMPYPHTNQAYWVVYGLLVPALLFVPFFLVSWFSLNNVTLAIALVGGLPALTLFRVLQALYGTLPPYVYHHPTAIYWYFGTCLQFTLDAQGQPCKISKARWFAKLQRFGALFVQSTLLYSILVPRGYRFMSIKTTSLPMLFMARIVNNYLLAILTSLILECKYFIAALFGNPYVSCVIIHFDSVYFSFW
jgi:hypothetical protein